MTRKHDMTIQCPNCGVEITSETSFGRWLRNRPDLDSVRDGISIMDNDFTVHQYRTELGRTFQCLMMIEIKTRGAIMSSAQRDTAGMLDQLIRNRRQTPTSIPRRQAGNGLAKVFSTFLRREVIVKSFGFHSLTFSDLGPDDSQDILWDRRHHITPDQLAQLIRFDLDPDTLRPTDWRRHHRSIATTDQLDLLATIDEL